MIDRKITFEKYSAIFATIQAAGKMGIPAAEVAMLAGYDNPDHPLMVMADHGMLTTEFYIFDHYNPCYKKDIMQLRIAEFDPKEIENSWLEGWE